MKINFSAPKHLILISSIFTFFKLPARQHFKCLDVIWLIQLLRIDVLLYALGTLRNDDGRLSRRSSLSKGTGMTTSVCRLSSYVTQGWILLLLCVAFCVVTAPCSSGDAAASFICRYILYMQNYSKCFKLCNC